MIGRREVLAGLGASVPVLWSSAPASAQPGLSVASVERWTKLYLAAWRNRDPIAAANLFTDDAVYESSPGDPQQRYVGRSAIADYWSQVTANQTDIRTRQGTAAVDGRRATIEIWVTLRAGGAPITIAEANLLTFDRSGRCSRNIEYPIVYDGIVTPPPGWGNG